jgi:hypothetical protein
MWALKCMQLQSVGDWVERARMMRTSEKKGRASSSLTGLYAMRVAAG